MAMFSFGKKKTQGGSQDNSTSAVDQIMNMTQQGYTNDQIADNLRGQGYDSSQIFDAMNQASMSQQQNMPSQPMIDDYNMAPQDPYGGGQEMPPMDPPPDMGAQQQQSYVAPVTDKERIEELAEAIIDEKWNELVRDIEKVIDWKEKTEARMNKIEQRLEDIKLSLDTFNKNLMGKISEYDKNISNVGVEIKAMEKVFQKVIPSLTENVNRLERIGKKAGPNK